MLPESSITIRYCPHVSARAALGHTSNESANIRHSKPLRTTPEALARAGLAGRALAAGGLTLRKVRTICGPVQAF
jgi:hypothetical protein